MLYLLLRCILATLWRGNFEKLNTTLPAVSETRLEPLSLHRFTRITYVLLMRQGRPRRL